MLALVVSFTPSGRKALAPFDPLILDSAKQTQKELCTTIPSECEDVTVRFIPSKHGKKLLLYKNYTYCYNLTYVRRGERWQCSVRTPKMKCLAYVRMQHGSVVEVIGDHIHSPPNVNVSKSGGFISF